MEKLSLIQKLRAHIPIIDWLPKYQARHFRWDLIAGFTLASFVLPESMAYATLAGLPTYFGIYTCLIGGLFFALFTTSRHVAVGPTSAISLMVGSTVAVMAGGDMERWAAIAELTALVVAVMCLCAFVLRLNSLVNFISDTILLGFKAGAALSIMATQLPKLFGLEGGGRHFFERIAVLWQQLPGTNWIVLGFGATALLLLTAGDHFFPRKPVSLVVVVAAIIVVSVYNLSAAGIHVAGSIPQGLPAPGRPSLKFTDVDGVLELGFACFLMGYIETISAARTFATKNNYVVNARQELLALGIANLNAAFGSAYVVSGGLSQSTVNEKSGAKTPLSLIICSFVLAAILLFFTGLLSNLPEVILAVIVLHAVAGLIKVKELKNIYRLNRYEFAVAMIAFGGVLVFGILKGVMLAVLMSLVLLIMRMAQPAVAVLGRIGNTSSYSDVERHPENILVNGVLILRIESSILYFNAEHIFEKIIAKLQVNNNTRLLVLDLSSASYVDVSGSKMLLQLSALLEKQNVQLKIVEALSGVRELLRKQGMERITGHISRRIAVDDVVREFEEGRG